MGKDPQIGDLHRLVDRTPPRPAHNSRVLTELAPMDEPENQEVRDGGESNRFVPSLACVSKDLKADRRCLSQVTKLKQRGWVYAQNALTLSRFSAMLAVVISALILIAGDVLCLVLSCLFQRDKATVEPTPEVHSSASASPHADSDDLDAKISKCRQAMADALPDQLAILVPRVAELAQALMIRFHQHGSLDDLDKQVELCDEILELPGPAPPSRASLLHELADPLCTRARLWGRPADLLRSIDLCREGLSLCSDIDRGCLLDSLGASLRVWYSQSGDRRHLEEAIQVHEQALLLRPSRHPMRHRSLGNSASALRLWYLSGGNVEDLDFAHERQLETIRLRPQGHPERYIALHELGCLLLDIFTTRGDHACLEKGTLAFEEALDCLGPEHQNRGFVLGGLAGALTYCFLDTRDLKVAECAVDLLLAALRTQKPGDFDRSRFLANLANLLLMRFDISHNVEDIDMAASMQRELVRTIELNHKDRPAHLGNLADILWFRYEARKKIGAIDVGELNEAVASAEEALARRPPGDPKRLHGLDHLARCLRARFAELGDDDDLERAISLHCEALASSHASHYDRYLYLGELACAFELRFERRGKNETDAKTALELTTEALNTTPEGHGGRPHLLQQLSRIQLLIGSGTSMQVTATSLCLIRDAILNDGHSANQRCADGMKILEILKDHSWDSPLRHLLLEVHNLLVRLLPRVAYFGLDLRSRLRVIRESESLANDAVGHALMLSNPTIAVELSEEGRGMFWNQALQLRTPVDSLPQPLAEQLVTISRQLEKDSHLESAEQKVPNDAADQKRRLGQKFEALIAEVQMLPGFERFMLPDSYTSLRTAARNGPVVILVASSVACQAIVLANPTAEARQIPLEISYEYLCNLGAITRDEGTKYRKAQGQRGMKVIRAPSDRSYSLLSELWNSVVFPAIEGIGLKVNQAFTHLFAPNTLTRRPEN